LLIINNFNIHIVQKRLLIGKFSALKGIYLFEEAVYFIYFIFVDFIDLKIKELLLFVIIIIC
jgi:hypothetical protein